MTKQFDLIIFDCDGVLMDSETVSAGVVSADLTSHGIPITPETAFARFAGVSLRDMKPLVEAESGITLPPDWDNTMIGKIAAAMEHGVTEIPGARAVLERLNALGWQWRIASNSADVEMDAKFTHTGFLDLTAGRTHSAPRLFAAGGAPKPAPDVFLDAARAEGVAPARCLVIEDSMPGIQGAVAAGMTCYAFSPDGDETRLLKAGATRVLRRLDDLVAMIDAESQPA